MLRKANTHARSIHVIIRSLDASLSSEPQQEHHQSLCWSNAQQAADRVEMLPCLTTSFQRQESTAISHWPCRGAVSLLQDEMFCSCSSKKLGLIFQTCPPSPARQPQLLLRSPPRTGEACLLHISCSCVVLEKRRGVTFARGGRCTMRHRRQQRTTTTCTCSLPVISPSRTNFTSCGSTVTACPTTRNVPNRLWPFIPFCHMSCSMWLS